MAVEPSCSVYSLKLKSRSKWLNARWSSGSRKPEGMTFKGGQFTDLTLVDPPKTEAAVNTRALGSSPGSNPTGPIHYIAGPPQMVAGLRAVLSKADIDDDGIRTEDFTGY